MRCGSYGCTAFPLLVTSESFPLPMLDSTDLLAFEAVAAAVGCELPDWAGNQ